MSNTSIRQNIYLLLIAMTFGFVTGCHHECSKKQPINVTVYNAGVSGNTSAQGLKRFDSDVLAKEPSIVVVGFGMNDAVNSHNCVNIKDFENNINEIIQRCHCRNIKVILNTVNPVTESELYKRHLESFYADYGGANEKIKAYNTVIKKIAADKKVLVADYYEVVMQAAFAAISKDGVHPTPQGCELLADVVESQLRKIVSDNDIVVCLGDSITKRGYPEIIQRRFSQPVAAKSETKAAGNTK